MKTMILAAVAALSAQQAPTPTLPVGEPIGTPSERLFSHAVDLLNQRLLDYPSARFRDVRADGGRVCGFVNAKNTMGAYTGWKPFGVMGDKGGLIWIDDAYMLEPLCTRALMETQTDYSDRLTYR